MNVIGTFDVIGPNMIGPSSSHTAGALRIARIAGAMVEKPVDVKFILYASFAHTYHGHGTDRALVAGLLGFQPDDGRIRDSFEYARRAGLNFSFEENTTEREIYPNTVDIIITGEDGSKVSLRGESIGGGNALITRLNDVEVELTGNLTTLILGLTDRKGTLALLTSLLSAYDINIATMRLYREGRKGSAAYAVTELDSPVKDGVVTALKGFEAVRDVIVIPKLEMSIPFASH